MEITLTPSQKRAYNIIMSGCNVFLTGHAGTGKSFLLRRIIKDLSKADKNVVIAAPTGVAAINVGGTTIHRLFALKPDVYVKYPPRVPSVLKETDVLIIDEISMCRIDLFDYIGRVLQKLRRPIQVIVVGDFCQLPPVMPQKGNDKYCDEKEILDRHFGFDVGGGYAFLAPQWQRLNFRSLVLEDVVRQDDPHFIEALDRARMGDAFALEYFAENARRDVIPDGIYLAGRNAEVDHVNSDKLKAIDEPPFFYHAQSVGEVSDEDRRVAPEHLELKVGTRIMTTCNHSLGAYSNGSVGTITELGEDYIRAMIDDGQEYEILPNTWEVIRYELDESDPEKPVFKRVVIGRYTQYPVKPAWAVTIHKSQGQTFARVNLNPCCWDSGQLYVALSRVKSIDGLHFTQPIYDRYLHLDPRILEFYEELDRNAPLV